MMSGLLSNAFRFIGRTVQQASQIYALPKTVMNNQIVPTTMTKIWSLNIFRNYYIEFKAREGKRIKTHGWRARLKTRNGRRILMRRILRGRYFISH